MPEGGGGGAFELPCTKALELTEGSPMPNFSMIPLPTDRLANLDDLHIAVPHSVAHSRTQVEEGASRIG